MQVFHRLGFELRRDGVLDIQHGRTGFDPDGFTHPIAAVGWNDQALFFVVVDGRQPRLSVGMTLPELASFLIELGCVQAMNLDGGGSAEVLVNGKIVNSPCYGRERNTANALVLLQRDEKPASP